MVIEILGTRVLAPFYGSTIFVWTALISVTLGFLALGYFIGGYIADVHPKEKWFYGIIFIAGFLTALFVKISDPVLLWSNVFGFQWGPLVAAFILFSLPFLFLGMVTPFAIRLRISSLEHTGHVSGTIFAIATVGSVVGAILAGFYFIPSFFTETIFIAVASVLMGTAIFGFFIVRGSRILMSVFIISLFLGVIIPAYSKTSFPDVSVLYREPSFYGEIRVVENNFFRCLSVNNQSQTCMRKADGTQALAYGNLIVALLEGFQLKNTLLIGLGGGILASDLQRNTHVVDSVEIDPKMVRAAKDFFGYDDANPSLNTFIADGRSFVRKTEKKYDVVILDAFFGSNPIPHLYTKEAFEEMKNILLPDGILVVNTLGRPYGTGSPLQHSVRQTLGAVFPHVTTLSTENIRENKEAFGNVLFVASFSERKLPIQEVFVVDYVKKDTENGIVLTDAYNPIETLGLAIYEESQRAYQNALKSL